MHIPAITADMKSDIASEWNLPGLIPSNTSTVPVISSKPQHASMYDESKPLIPVDLYRNILRCSSRRDLSRLCLVSRDMSSEAQYMLYRDVDLHDCAESRIRKWANTLENSPHLAKILRSLCISSTYVRSRRDDMGHFSHDDPTLLALKSALKEAVNMTAFTAQECTLLNVSMGGTTSKNTIDLSVLDDRIQHLRRFDIHGSIIFTGGRTIDLYSRMADLIELTPDTTIARTSLPPTILPNLSIVTLRLFSFVDVRLLEFATSRRIQHLRIDYAEFHSRFDTLERVQAIRKGVARSTLTHLQIETDGSSSAPDESQLQQPMDIAENFAVQFDGLKFLSLMASHRSASVSLSNDTKCPIF